MSPPPLVAARALHLGGVELAMLHGGETTCPGYPKPHPNALPNQPHDIYLDP